MSFYSHGEHSAPFHTARIRLILLISGFQLYFYVPLAGRRKSLIENPVIPYSYLCEHGEFKGNA